MCKECENYDSVTTLRQKYEKKTGNKWERKGGFFKSEKDPYVRFLEEELTKNEKAEHDTLNKVINNDL